MKWLTEKQVREYATTPRKALEISIKAWWQKATATMTELKRIKHYRDLHGAEKCGLCIFSRDAFGSLCLNCCLHKMQDGPCGKNDNTVYSIARIALERFLKHRTKENYETYHKAAGNMHKVLCSLRKK